MRLQRKDITTAVYTRKKQNGKKRGGNLTQGTKGRVEPPETFTRRRVGKKTHFQEVPA